MSMLLVYIRNHPGCTQVEMKERLKLLQSQVSVGVDRLEDRGDVRHEGNGVRGNPERYFPVVREIPADRDGKSTAATADNCPHDGSPKAAGISPPPQKQTVKPKPVPIPIEKPLPQIEMMARAFRADIAVTGGHITAIVPARHTSGDIRRVIRVLEA